MDIAGKLVGVPLSLGEQQESGSVVKTTFYILGGCMSYHWLLGLTFLAPIDAAILCKARALQYRLPSQDQPQVLPLQPRSFLPETAIHRDFYGRACSEAHVAKDDTLPP